ncbi:MAG TPA: MFS transporter [Candidatus Saccharimonadales bacterium]|nr:MFS transporter [Candidatus Saccharimonadales bacterium]
MSTKVPVLQQIRGLKPNFWFSNWMEANERLAFFGVRAILPLSMVYAVAQGGMGLTYSQKGLIYSVWALVQCLVPMISGGFTDQYGYKKSLYVAYTINILGYLCFAFATGFWSALGASCLIGLGTAIFKPPVQGTIAKASTEDNSSIAWGVFYWMVNLGGFLAPMLAAQLRGETNFKLVFYCAAGVTAFNFVPTLLFYKEPEKVGPSEYKSPGQTFVDTITTLKDKNFLIFLGIFSGFWFMFMQLWDLLPNFIDEWVNSRDIAGAVHAMNPGWLLASGNVKPEILVNIDSAAIIAFMLIIAWMTGKLHPMVALISGMVVSVVAFIGTGVFNVGLLVALAIFIFAVGEMMCSPKFSEYIGLTAPADKKAVYMGYSNIPFAVGWGLGNLISGPLYEHLGSRVHFAREYLVHNLGMPAAAVARIPEENVLSTMTARLNGGLGGTVEQANTLLWNAHHPWRVWVILGAVGLLSTLAMVGYYQKTKHSGISSNQSAAA